MAPKIETGDQYDQSTSEHDLRLHKDSNLHYKTGDLHDTSKSKVKVSELDSKSTPLPLPSASDSVHTFWARGTFLVLAFAVVASVLGALAHWLPWFLVPTCIVGAIVVLYFFAVVLFPGGRLTEKGFLRVIDPYMRQVFAVRPSLDRRSKN